FSSRRRHTRSLRDWSSDVCSSDLEKRLLQSECRGRKWLARSTREHQEGNARRGGAGDRGEAREGRHRRALLFHLRISERAGRLRSEERRVGKEWRSRWWACD